MGERCQTVYITLRDGRSGSFTGRVLVEPDEAGEAIASVMFSEPMDLAPDVSFEAIKTLLPGAQPESECVNP